MDVNTLNCLEFEQISLGKTSKLIIQVKCQFGKKFIDIRKWIQWNTMEGLLTKKGICLEFSDWKRVSEVVERMIDKSA